MPYNFAADSFHIKKLCNRLFFKRSAILEGKLPFCVFEPPLGDLGAMNDDYLRLIGKRIVDFLLVLTELFCPTCYGGGATDENISKISDFVPMRSV